MFSPITVYRVIPTARARSLNFSPCGVSWEKYPRRAMFSELVLAIRHKSGSHISGGKPLLARSAFVCSNALFSIGFASSIFGDFPGEAIDASVVAEATRRGRVTAGVDEISLATGRVSTLCPSATPHRAEHTRTIMKPGGWHTEKTRRSKRSEQ